jgi:cleavage and polyadenylation specificity factor subunit 1
VSVLFCDHNNELEELEENLDEALLDTKWVSGCLYRDVHGRFCGPDEKQAPEQQVFMALLSAEGALLVSLPFQWRVVIATNMLL